MNTRDLPQVWLRAERRVLEIQTKLHRWANDDPRRRFDDLYNLVTDPGVLLMAWERVAGNTGARSAGVDGRTAAFVEDGSAWRTTASTTRIRSSTGNCECPRRLISQSSQRPAKATLPKSLTQ